jgi:hypothetical protein
VWYQDIGGDVLAIAYRLQPADPPGDRPGPGGRPPANSPAENEDLAYKVEVWDRAGEFVEQVLAVTSSASIGYAAYYAATREFPDQVITLRHRNSVMSRWSGKPH